MTKHRMPTIETLSRDRIHTWIPTLAELRVRVFRDFPYCYDGRG